MYTKVIRATGLAVHLVAAAQLTAYRALNRRGGQNVEGGSTYKVYGPVVVVIGRGAVSLRLCPLNFDQRGGLINFDDGALYARLVLNWAENDRRTHAQLEHVQMKREARGRHDDDDVRKEALLGPLSHSAF